MRRAEFASYDLWGVAGTYWSGWRQPIQCGRSQPKPPAAQLRLQHAVLFTEKGDHIALLGLEPPKQRRQQHLQRNHTARLYATRAASVFGQFYEAALSRYPVGRSSLWPIYIDLQ